MKILITGATGFTGSYVARRLADGGLDVTCFVRPSSNRSVLAGLPVRFVEGALENAAALAEALKGADALVNVASLGFGHAPNVLEACSRSGVRRAVFFSTTGIFTKLNPDSKRVRLAAEEAIRGSGLDFTILRPTMIYGSERDRNICRLVKFLSRSPVMPVFGPGTHLQQPVYVKDLAEAVYAALGTPAAMGQAYNVCGAAPISFNELIDTTAKALGRRILKLHIPVSPSLAAVRTYNRLSSKPRIKVEQVLRLNEDKAFPIEEARRDLNYRPIDFATGIRYEIDAIRSAARR